MSTHGDTPSKDTGKASNDSFGPFSMHKSHDERLPSWITIAIALAAFWTAVGFIAYHFLGQYF
jgi:hypothetical protein